MLRDGMMSTCFLTLRLSFGMFSLSMSTKEASKTEGKKAGNDAPPVSIGWDSHQAVVRTSLDVSPSPLRWRVHSPLLSLLLLVG